MPLGLSGSGLITGFDPSASGFGKVLQVVRATDTTARGTNSTSFVDVTGMSVTITPQRSTSAILLICSVKISLSHPSNLTAQGEMQITDSSNNAINGAEAAFWGFAGLGLSSAFFNSTSTIFAYDTPATTSAKTYKLRFRMLTGTADITLNNNNNTGQMYAIEVSA